MEAGALAPELDRDATMLAALELGLADYVRKCGFSSVVLGLSGGIDSAVTCAIAARALGPERVTGLLMPSPYSSDHSVSDALELARRLGVTSHTLPIEGPMMAFDATLHEVFMGALFTRLVRNKRLESSLHWKVNCFRLWNQFALVNHQDGRNGSLILMLLTSIFILWIMPHCWHWPSSSLLPNAVSILAYGG